ncbi:transketolase [Riemerella anatipestifer]|uniref:Transketolase n=1 Tax=Riemerella anatipestifer TaxID=34085 RepID=A0AAP3ALA9_RIEAN|nr:transketolase [Riemerella anatipestifer]MBT0572237.1 transketolase [Riemerella anatipestifer]MCW0510881.1 transketolase [Riemerella anatipestifer]MCW0519540.1 transketolase [Riemerella anatipestifer]MCW0523712.1 transketolase [Riemerella anatipestifer]MDD1539214.1 transketolase [Riemerella anatipestifer]
MAKSVEELKHLTTQIRRDILRMVHAVNSGHPGGSLGCVEYFTALYGKVMNYSLPFKMEGKNEDLFFLSNGHISPVYYSTLARFNFFPVEELATFRKLNTRLQGHPTTHEGLPGVRIASGSLGQGLSVAVGAALGKKLDNDKSIVFSLHGDGELQEGQIWEALMYASHNKVDNLIATIDYNNRQIDGDVSDVLSLGNLKAKLEAFDWQVLEVKEGNNLEAVIAVLEEAKAQTGKGKPIAIIMHTEMGNGVDFMMGTHAWHGKAPNDEQLEKALAQLSTDNLADY